MHDQNAAIPGRKMAVTDGRLHQELVRMSMPRSRRSWLDRSVDASGLPVRATLEPRTRPCGWALHHVQQQQLPVPLCVQRPLEGCFRTFAMPNEMAPYLPATYWNRTRDRWPKLEAPLLSLQLDRGLGVLQKQLRRAHRTISAHEAPLVLLNLQPRHVDLVVAFTESAPIFHEALSNLSHSVNRRLEPQWTRCIQMATRNKCNSVC
jgi:hypothetical protein